jgi:DmsE family decaheme c-type cytochrome
MEKSFSLSEKGLRSNMNKHLGLKISLMVLFVFVSLQMVAAINGKDQKKDKSAKKEAVVQTVSDDPKNYVGADTCKTCHDDQFKQYQSSAHWQTMKDTRRGVAYQGCEACHGPGKVHAEAPSKDNIVSFTNLHGSEFSARCLKCHQQSDERSNFERSAHHRSNVGCNECHSTHTPKVQDAMLKQNSPTLCFTCHLEVKSAFSKPFHHRVNEGLVKCTDCHNPHGGFLARQLRDSAANDIGCFKCHAEKAGPFAFEHAPVKTEGCVACHTPHGSANPRLLKRAQINLLCLECHTLTTDTGVPALPTFHNQASKYQACTMCHTQIHGSNASNRFFK